jgi:hypothetical protein
MSAGADNNGVFCREDELSLAGPDFCVVALEPVGSEDVVHAVKCGRIRNLVLE